MLTEGHGVPIGAVIEGANRHDMKLVRSTIQSIIIERPRPTEEHPQGMCHDKGYDYDEVYATLLEFGFTAHVRPRGEEAQAIKRFRRLLVRWEKKPQNYLAFLHFAWTR
jgi:putative transposase